ncbi:MAG: hypothetical protein SPL42_09115 [Bacteroidales bacterium]|nr:hypothetical protein [Bacteroidales bacterium]
MKKYTNKILIITAIVLVLGLIIGYTIDFQTGYRSGRIKYEERNLDSLEMVIRDAMDETSDTYTVTETDNEAQSDNQIESSNQ